MNEKETFKPDDSAFPGGYCVLKAVGSNVLRPVFLSDGFCAMLGMERSSIMEQSDPDAIDFIHPHDRALCKKVFQAGLAGGGPFSAVFRLAPASGRPLWVNANCRAVKEGGSLYVYAAYTNADEASELRERLAASEERFRLAAEGAGLTVWEYDLDKRRIIINSAACDDLGVPQVIEDVPDSLLRLLAREEEKPLFLKMYSDLAAGADKVSGEFWLHTGSGLPLRCERVNYALVKDEQGRPVKAYGLSQDVTRERHERDKFRDSMQALLDTNPRALCTFQLNLTRNSCSEGHGISPYIIGSLGSDTADGLFENSAALILHDCDKDNFERTFSRAGAIAAFESGRQTLSLDYRRRREDGGALWVRTYLHMLRNPETKDVEGVIYSLDISELMRNNEIFRLITNQEYDYVALLHQDEDKIEFLHLSDKLHPKYHRELGAPGRHYDFTTVRKFAAASWMDRSMREDYLRKSSVEVVKRELDEHGHYELTVTGHYTGQPDSVMCRKIQHYYLDSEKDAILIVQTDVTQAYLHQQRELETARAEARRSSEILNSISCGVCVLRMPDEAHVSIDFCNEQMYRLLGFEPDVPTPEQVHESTHEAVAAYFRDIFSGIHPDDVETLRDDFRRGYSLGAFVTQGVRMLGGDGGYRLVTIDVKLHCQESGGDRIFYGTYRDVSQEVRLQHELKERLAKEEGLRLEAMSANRAKSEFLSRMSHDIRTPMNGIIGMTHIAREQSNPPRTEDALDKIEISSKFLLGLVNDILDMARIESGEVTLHPEPCEPREFIDYINSVIRPLCEEKHQTLTLSGRAVGDRLPLLDKLRVNQIVFNLLSNAVKYTPEGGRIECDLDQHFEGEKIRLTALVRDNGIGMSEEFQSVLFQPFTQEERMPDARSGSSGLGLAIVKRLIDLMDGSITVESAPGLGTSFTCTALFDSVPAEAVQAAANEGKRSLGALRGMHVLLCEDHPLNQEIAKNLLDEAGLITELADNGARGAELFAASPSGYYDAVLMDIRMPVMDGYEATRTIRALKRPDAATVRIIAMTADAYEDDIKKCLTAGMNAHIAKPIEPDLLYKELLAARPGAA